MVKIKAHELRDKSKSDLLAQLKELKTELAQLRVAKVTGGAPNKLSKIKIVRKSVARVLTVYRQSQLTALRTKAKDDHKDKKGKTFLPLDMRPKKTRAQRKALSKEQARLVTSKEKKRAQAFPRRNYALKA